MLHALLSTPFWEFLATLLYVAIKELLIVLIASGILLGAPWLTLLNVELGTRELGGGLEEELHSS